MGVCAAALAGHTLSVDAFAQATTVIVPGAIVLPDGSLAEGKAVVVRDGKIVAIDDASAHVDRADAIRRPGTTLSPGLIDPYSALGVVGNNVERVIAIDPDLNAFDAVDRWDSAWAGALAGGVTTVMIVPGSNNLVAGTTAVMRTGNGLREPESLREQAAMLFSFGTPALDSRRAPTSRSGAITMLRSAFSSAKAGAGHPRLAAVLDGSLRPIVRADSGEDVTAAIRFFEVYGITPAIVHTDQLLEVADDLADAAVPVIVGPYITTMPEHVLLGPARLGDEGIEFAFAGNTPFRDAASLRMAAALAVRAGLDPAAARRGLTVNGARILGVDEIVGSIAVGRDADLVIFSGDPLRPDTRVLEVYLRGVVVHAAPDLHEEIVRLEPDEEVGVTAEGVNDDATE